MATENINTRVLIIDDEEIVRDNIEDILVPKRSQQNEMVNNAASILFDDAGTDESILSNLGNSSIPVFSVDKAINGMDGLEKVKKAIAQKKPYAVIFLDMRMPVWDGLETALHIRDVDTKVEIIIITAFSDRSIGEIAAKIGQNVGYHCKPYAPEEILQLATKGINDYNKLRNLEKLIHVISNINVSKAHLDSLLQNILDQLAMYIGSDMAVLGKFINPGTYQQLFSLGPVENQINIDRLSTIIKSANFDQGEVLQVDELVFIKMEDYHIFAALSKNQHLKTEKLYLLKLFVHSAAKAIKNAQLHEKMIQQEKLVAVGKALGMLMHDLRVPMKSIPMLTNAIRAGGPTGVWLDIIDKCGEEASEIFDDFLDFIRDAPLEMQRVSVTQLVHDGIGLTKKMFGINNITLQEDIEPDLYLLGDNSKLKRVLMNLLNNAVDVLGDAKTEDPTIEISAKKIRDEIVITIRDNGPGIPEKILDSLFDAFITAGKSNGTGLGLAIVKQYIEAHNGTISVQNGPGAEFTITLPSTT